MVLGSFGWFWVVLAGCVGGFGWWWMVLAGCGWFFGSSNPPVVTGIWDPNKSQAWQNHFFVYKQNLWLDNLKTKTAMKVKISVFIICVKVIMYLILHNLHDCYIPLNDVYWNDKIEISR